MAMPFAKYHFQTICLSQYHKTSLM